MLAAVLVFVYSFSVSQADVARHAEVLETQRLALTHLCETVHVIDVIYVQSAVIDRALIRDPTLSRNIRNLLRKRLAVLETAHQDLSDNRACRQVE